VCLLVLFLGLRLETPGLSSHLRSRQDLRLEPPGLSSHLRSWQDLRLEPPDLSSHSRSRQDLRLEPPDLSSRLKWLPGRKSELGGSADWPLRSKWKLCPQIVLEGLVDSPAQLS
jgi:hypothetical protein